MATYSQQPPPGDWFDQQDPAVYQPGGPDSIQHYQQGGGQQQQAQEQFQIERMYEIMSKYPPTNEGFRQGIAEAQSIFGKDALELLEHPQRLDKFKTKTGEVYDIMYAAGDPAARWRGTNEWHNEAGMPHGSSVGGMAGGNFMAGKDPSYDFVQKEALKALQNSAAAKGTLMTGGFAKDAMAQAAGIASGEFQNIYNRNMGIADLGLRASNIGAQSGSAYGQGASNTVLGRGNAQGGAAVARGNANSDTWGTIGNVAGGYFAGRRQKPKPYNQSTYSGSMPAYDPNYGTGMLS